MIPLQSAFSSGIVIASVSDCSARSSTPTFRANSRAGPLLSKWISAVAAEISILSTSGIRKRIETNSRHSGSSGAEKNGTLLSCKHPARG